MRSINISAAQVGCSFTVTDGILPSLVGKVSESNSAGPGLEPYCKHWVFCWKVESFLGKNPALQSKNPTQI